MREGSTSSKSIRQLASDTPTAGQSLPLRHEAHILHLIKAPDAVLSHHVGSTVHEQVRLGSHLQLLFLIVAVLCISEPSTQEMSDAAMRVVLQHIPRLQWWGRRLQAADNLLKAIRDGHRWPVQDVATPSKQQQEPAQNGEWRTELSREDSNRLAHCDPSLHSWSQVATARR